MDARALAEMMKARREALGLTQLAASELLGCSDRHLREFESTGKGSLQFLAAMLAAYKLSIEPEPTVPSKAD